MVSSLSIWILKYFTAISSPSFPCAVHIIILLFPNNGTTSASCTVLLVISFSVIHTDSVTQGNMVQMLFQCFKITLFYSVVLCSSIDVYQYIRRTRSLHSTMKTLNMEMVGLFRMLEPMCDTTWSHIPEDHNLLISMKEYNILNIHLCSQVRINMYWTTCWYITEIVIFIVTVMRTSIQ